MSWHRLHVRNLRQFLIKPVLANLERAKCHIPAALACFRAGGDVFYHVCADRIIARQLSTDPQFPAPPGAGGWRDTLVPLQAIRPTFPIGRLAGAPSPAHRPAGFDMRLNPCDRIRLDIQKGVLFRLHGIGFLLAARIDSNRNRLRLTRRALRKEQIHDPTVVLFDRFALAKQLARACGMTGH